MAPLHRDPERQLHFDSKFGHEDRVLVTKKCLPAGNNRITFSARYLEVIFNPLHEQEKS